MKGRYTKVLGRATSAHGLVGLWVCNSANDVIIRSLEYMLFRYPFRIIAYSVFE